MPNANQSDFFGEGTAEQAFAPIETPAQAAERQRLEQLRLAEERRRSAEQTASRNAPYQNQVRAYQPEQARQESITRNSKAGEAGNDWMYPGIVAGTIAGGIGAAGLVGAAGAGAAAAPAFSAVGPASGAVAGGVGAAVPTVLTAGGGAGLAGGTAAAAAPAAASWLTPANALAAGGLAISGGTLIANQIRTKAEKDLIKKQEEIAAAAELRRNQVQQEGMNRLGQQMLAMNPMNQTMAEMFGPGAAFSPQQMGGMVADPGAKSQADYDAAYQQSQATGRPMEGFSQQDKERMLADQKRQAMVQANTTPLGPGPAPLQQRAPQAARRF